MTAPQHPAPTAESGCVCSDPEVDRLRRLIRNGWDLRGGPMTPALARVVNAATLPALAALAVVDIAAGTLRFWREVRQEARAFIAAVAGEES